MVTAKLGLTIPTPGQRNWTGDHGVTVGNNFQLIDDKHDIHDTLVEKTTGHGIILASKLGTSIVDLSAVDENLIRLMMVLG